MSCTLAWSREHHIEQIKGHPYPVDTLIGQDLPASDKATKRLAEATRSANVVQDREFADVNGIKYSLGQILGDAPTDVADGDDAPAQEGRLKQQWRRIWPKKGAVVVPDDVQAKEEHVAHKLGLTRLLDMFRGDKKGPVDPAAAPDELATKEGVEREARERGTPRFEARKRPLLLRGVPLPR